MSASICFEPVDPDPGYISVRGTTSSFIEAMGRANFALPCELNSDAIPVLEGMAAVDPGGGFNETIKLIREYGRIRLWAEH